MPWRLICALVAVAIYAVPVLAQPAGFEARFVEQELRAYAASQTRWRSWRTTISGGSMGCSASSSHTRRAGHAEAGNGSPCSVATRSNSRTLWETRAAPLPVSDLDSRTAVFATAAPGRLPAQVPHEVGPPL